MTKYTRGSQLRDLISTFHKNIVHRFRYQRLKLITPLEGVSKKCKREKETRAVFNFPLGGSRRICRGAGESGHFHRAKRRGKNMVPRPCFTVLAPRARTCSHRYFPLLSTRPSSEDVQSLGAKYRSRGTRVTTQRRI